MDPILLTAIVGVLSSVLTLVGVIVAQRYGFLGKKIEGESSSYARTLQRVDQLEGRNDECEIKLAAEREARLNDKFEYNSDLDSVEMMVDMLLKECPSAGKDVEEARARMRERRLERQEKIRQERLLAASSGEYSIHATNPSNKV